MCSLMHLLNVSEQSCYRAGCNVPVLVVFRALAASYVMHGAAKKERCVEGFVSLPFDVA